MSQQIDHVNVWLDNVGVECSQSENTKIGYRKNFKKFCEFIGKKPSEIIKDYEEAENEQKLRRHYGMLLRAWISHLNKTGRYTPSSIATFAASVKSFFAHFDLLLPNIKSGRRIVVYGNRDITREEVLSIVRAAKYPRDRAFFCVMAQSGLRPNELCNLKAKNIEHLLDFDVKKKSYIIWIPQLIAKGKYKEFFTFIPHESMVYLRSYLKTRKNVNEESHVFAMLNNDLKPAATASMTHLFRRVVDKLKQSGEIEFERRVGKPSQVRLYNLRKFFRKFASQAGSDFVNFWMGHVSGVDLGHYFSRDVEMHRQVYEEKAIPFLRLETKTPSETEKQIDVLSEQLKNKDEVIETMKKRLDDLEKAMNDALLLRNQKPKEEK